MPAKGRTLLLASLTRVVLAVGCWRSLSKEAWQRHRQKGWVWASPGRCGESRSWASQSRVLHKPNQEARPPTGLVHPRALRGRAAAQICRQPSPPLPCLYPRLSTTHEEGDLRPWRLLVLSIQLLDHECRSLGSICLDPVCAPHMPEFLFLLILA